MQTGAFALIDALGFKGIWKKHGEEQILAKLQKMERTTREQVDFANRRPSLGFVGNVHVTFLSDTIAIGCELGQEPPESNGLLTRNVLTIGRLVLLLSSLLKSAALTDPPLAYRGCVSAGSFTIRSNFILGPAVDQAASMDRVAEGAFVWLDRGARDMLEAERISKEPAFPEALCLHRVRVPMKGDQFSQTLAVLPYKPEDSDELKARINARLLSSFDDTKPDVAVKRDNTRSFLETGAEASTAALQEVASQKRMFGFPS
jgi:hypothetical protein